VIQDAILQCIILVEVALDLHHVTIMLLGTTVSKEVPLLTAHLEVVMRQGLDLRIMIAVLIKVILIAPTMVATAVALMSTVHKKATSPFDPKHLHPLTSDLPTHDDLDLLPDNVIRPIARIEVVAILIDKGNLDNEVDIVVEVAQDSPLNETFSKAIVHRLRS
jgi:hypothetical protein